MTWLCKTYELNKPNRKNITGKKQAFLIKDILHQKHNFWSAIIHRAFKGDKLLECLTYL